MKIRQGIFFQSVGGEIISTRDELPAGYYWGAIDEESIMNEPIFAIKDRRVKARVRLADGHNCYGFRNKDGVVVYFMWITFVQNSQRLVPWELNTQLILKPKTSYFWDCFTAPEHRRCGLYRTALRVALSLAIKQGAEKNFICCMRENEPSVNAIRLSGFHDIFNFTVGRIGPFVFCRRSDSNVSIKFGIPRFDILGN